MDTKEFNPGDIVRWKATGILYTVLDSTYTQVRVRITNYRSDLDETKYLYSDDVVMHQKAPRDTMSSYARSMQEHNHLSITGQDNYAYQNEPEKKIEPTIPEKVIITLLNSNNFIKVEQNE